VLGAPEVPVPFAALLESEWLPSRDRITGHVLGQAPGDAAVPEPIGGDRAQQPA